MMTMRGLGRARACDRVGHSFTRSMDGLTKARARSKSKVAAVRGWHTTNC
jgi:hypothetical protein